MSLLADGKVRYVKGPDSQRAFAQLADLQMELRPGGTVYSTLPGTTTIWGSRAACWRGRPPSSSACLVDHRICRPAAATEAAPIRRLGGLCMSTCWAWRPGWSLTGDRSAEQNSSGLATRRNVTAEKPPTPASGTCPRGRRGRPILVFI